MNIPIETLKQMIEEAQDIDQLLEVDKIVKEQKSFYRRSYMKNMSKLNDIWQNLGHTLIDPSTRIDLRIHVDRSLYPRQGSIYLSMHADLATYL